MPSPSVWRRWFPPLIAAVVILVIGVPQVKKLADDRELLKPYDFVQYWSAGKQLLDGKNPYDPDQLIWIQRSMYDGVDKVIMMWNPPWTLPLVMPFAALPWRLAQFLWLGLQLGAVLLSADLLWRVYGGDPARRWIAWLLALTFAPTLFLLLIGQISGLVLLGVSGFLYFERAKRPMLAGCCAALTAIKPHLFALFALALLLESFGSRRVRSSILAGACVLIAASALPLLWNPHVWSDYVEATRRPSAENFDTMRQFEHPTIGFWLRQQAPGQPFGVQFIPLLVALLALVAIWVRRRGVWTWEDCMPLLVLVSVLTAAYGAWAFDLVVLLVAVIPMGAKVLAGGSPLNGKFVFCAAIAYLILNFLVLRTIREAGSQSNPWIAPVVFLAYVAVWMLQNRISRTSP